MRRLFLILSVGVLLGLTLTLAAAPASAQKGKRAPIRLVAGTFNPAAGETLNGELNNQAELAVGLGYYIVQFNGPVRQEWKDALTATGAELLSYIPENAFQVRMDAAQAGNVRTSPNIRWVGVFQPGYKLGADLKRGDTAAYTVRVHPGIDANVVAAAIAATGAQVFEGDEDILRVAANGSQVDAIARIADVAYIENYVLPRKHNDYGAGNIIGANVANTNGYDGSTQTAAVADTGLGNGTAAGAHPDIPASRVVSVNNWPGKPGICFTNIDDDGAQDVDSGHGTHVSGSVLGDGGASGEGKGSAPAARLVFQATENWAELTPICQSAGEPTEGYFLTGLPEKLKKLFQQAYNGGARVHSNSWGSAQDGAYTSNSAQVDDFSWKKRDLLITYSAGNDGQDGNDDGVVDNGSLGSPATAKNSLAVGASENDRQGHWECDPGLTYTSHDLYQPGETCASMGGQNLLGTWGQRYPDSFSANPLKNDVTAGNQEQMASWSSRGPVDDGRIKPDVVAPGTWILSASASPYQEGYGDPINPKLGEHAWDGWGMPRNEFYKYMGGTSMSNPIAAGGAVVVRDYYQKAEGHNASSALVKATLVNSAVDMQDENNDGSNDNDFPIPNMHEGWGRVNLANATDGTRQFVDDATGLTTGTNDEYQYNLGAGQLFKVTLAYTDFPSSEFVARNLVNDLNLLVISPGGVKYKGNKFQNGWSKTGGKPDKLNNVENVYIQSAEAGVWTVRVVGKNVPNGPQPYALVVKGP